MLNPRTCSETYELFVKSHIGIFMVSVCFNKCSISQYFTLLYRCISLLYGCGFSTCY